MARQARIVIPGLPHHVVHRGNLRAQVFFSDDDRRFYLEMLGQGARASRESIKTLELETGTSMTPQARKRKPAAANVIGLTEDMFA